MVDNFISKGEVIGLIPAGGTAERLSPLPCSKELYPIGFRSIDGKRISPKVVSHYLLERMRQAGISKSFIIIRNGKWDILSYWGNGAMLNMNLAYLTVIGNSGVPFTLDAAYPFIKDAYVAFGFPDILFRPGNVYKRLLTRMGKTSADVVLGLFHVPKAGFWDLVELDNRGGIKNILVKPGDCGLKYTWINAVWSPRFSHFMHKFVADKLSEFKKVDIGAHNNSMSEIYISAVIQEALQQGFTIEGVICPDGKCLDIGTPADLARVVGEIKYWND